jgi:His/Glu/Gln/Arg/opine family amino acid ABC transporter permease subunit
MLRSLLALLLFCLALPTLAQTDDSLARVKARGVLKIATDATYPPFEFMENSKVVGFDAELAVELGRELGMPVEMVSMEWSGVFAAVETGKCDLVMSGVTITGERKKGNGFTRPYFLSGQVIARKKGSAISKPSDVLAESRTAAVQQETTGQFAMEKAGVPKTRLHRFDTLQDGLMDVKNGKSDVAVGDEPALAEIIRKGYPELELAPGGPFVEENLGIVAKKDALTLLAALNLALERVIVDGRYARLYEKWMHKPMMLASVAKLEAVKGDGTPIPAELLTKATKVVASSEAPTSGTAFTIRPELLVQSLPLLLKGALLTLELTLITLVLGVPLGLGIALVRLGKVAPLRSLAIAYVEAVRGTPLLMQIYVIYFVFPAIGISLNPFVAGVMALSLNAAAYASEIFRAGIESIDTGQREAARALGMTGGQAMRYVILPQTFQRVLPPLTNEAVALLKDSSLVSVVALTELMRVGKELATTAGAPTTIYLAVAVIYLAMTLPLTAIVRRLEKNV